MAHNDLNSVIPITLLEGTYPTPRTSVGLTHALAVQTIGIASHHSHRGRPRDPYLAVDLIPCRLVRPRGHDSLHRAWIAVLLALSMRQ
jgi:hypothetical protein